MAFSASMGLGSSVCMYVGLCMWMCVYEGVMCVSVCACVCVPVCVCLCVPESVCACLCVCVSLSVCV